MEPLIPTTTIAAIATPSGRGGIAVIRLSGPDAISIANAVWHGKSLVESASHKAHYGNVVSNNNEVIDDALALVMRAPHSYTGEDTVEFSVHGSTYIQRQLLKALIDNGASPAGPGEFTQRAFLNGKLDLAQAESVADLIDSESRAAHRLAMTQMKGAFSSRLDMLRSRLIEFASLMELELDFSEEDVEFADRSRLLTLAREVKTEVDKLANSFSTGMAIKNGIPTAIIGAPNTGKSTLLNRLIGEEKAIVSDIPGTTRDAIEDVLYIGANTFRLIDTAGLRHTTDTIESIGIERTLSHVEKAAVVLVMLDATKDIGRQIDEIRNSVKLTSKKKILWVVNKSDLASVQLSEYEDFNCVKISAATGYGIEELTSKLSEIGTDISGSEEDVIVSNARHYEELRLASEDLARVIDGMQTGLPTDLIAQDLRAATSHIGRITGAITSDTLLHTIFSRFCIGK